MNNKWGIQYFKFIFLWYIFYNVQVAKSNNLCYNEFMILHMSCCEEGFT